MLRIPMRLAQKEAQNVGVNLILMRRRQAVRCSPISCLVLMSALTQQAGIFKRLLQVRCRPH
jgi:hypothetical protein